MTLNKTTIDASHDPMGSAISDYYKNGRAAHLRVLSSMFEEDEMPVAHLFRSEQEMPQLEKRALELVRGKVLDIGAGAGCHALALKKNGFEVKAIDVSPLSCEVMKARGIEDVECINLFDPQLQGKFDTILLLMNGTGIAGKLALADAAQPLEGTDGRRRTDSYRFKRLDVYLRKRGRISGY